MAKELKAELVRPGVYRCTWGYSWDLRVYGCEGYDVNEVDDDIDLLAEELVTVGHWHCEWDALMRSTIRIRHAFEYWRSELLACDSLGIFHYPEAGIIQVGPRTGGVEELISDLTEEAFEAMAACASAS